MIICPDFKLTSVRLVTGSARTDIFSGGFGPDHLRLTGSSDGTHLGDLSQGPAASRFAAALHLCVATVQLGGAAAVSQRREAGANALIWKGGEKRGQVQVREPKKVLKTPKTGAGANPATLEPLSRLTREPHASKTQYQLNQRIWVGLRCVCVCGRCCGILQHVHMSDQLTLESRQLFMPNLEELPSRNSPDE